MGLKQSFSSPAFPARFHYTFRVDTGGVEVIYPLGLDKMSGLLVLSNGMWAEWGMPVQQKGCKNCYIIHSISCHGIDGYVFQMFPIREGGAS